MHASKHKWTQGRSDNTTIDRMLQKYFRNTRKRNTLNLAWLFKFGKPWQFSLLDRNSRRCRKRDSVLKLHRAKWINHMSQSSGMTVMAETSPTQTWAQFYIFGHATKMPHKMVESLMTSTDTILSFHTVFFQFWGNSKECKHDHGRFWHAITGWTNQLWVGLSLVSKGVGVTLLV